MTQIPYLQLQKTGRIAIMTLNRPDQLNAIGSHEDCQSLIGALEAVAADAEIAVVILTGAGTSFCAGGNLKNMRDRVGIGALEGPVKTRDNYKRGIQKIPQALWNLEVPTIAAINGHAIGVGLDIACMCDIRIAAEDAKLGASFIKVGLIPGDGGSYFLPKAVGLSKAAEMIFTGDSISADEALECGLVSRVVPKTDLMNAAQKLAERIADKPPQTLRLAKRLLREGQHARLSEILELSAAFQAIVHETEDHQEALAAFFEKRRPEFRGN